MLRIFTGEVKMPGCLWAVSVRLFFHKGEWPPPREKETIGRC